MSMPLPPGWQPGGLPGVPGGMPFAWPAWQGLAPVTLTNNFEGGTSSVSVSAANSGGASGNSFDLVTIGTSATVAYDSAHAAHGLLGCQVATAGTAAQAYVSWSTSLSARPVVWFRQYLYVTANPAASIAALVFRTSDFGGSTCAFVNLLTTGQLQFVDFLGGGIFTTAASVPLSQWFRIEGFVTGSATAGQAELKLFTTADSVNPAETDTSAANRNTFGPVAAVHFGVTGNLANAGPFWMDDLGLSTTGYLGPVPGNAPVYPLQRPVRARAVNTRPGTVSHQAGAWQGTGAPVRPLSGPVRAVIPQRAPRGQVTRLGGILGGAGPALKALAAAISARLRVLPPRGRTAGRTGVQQGTGPAPKPLSSPARAQPGPQRGGHAASRAGTFTAGAPQAGPPLYPLGHPVTARRPRLPFLTGRARSTPPPRAAAAPAPAVLTAVTAPAAAVAASAASDAAPGILSPVTAAGATLTAAAAPGGSASAAVGAYVANMYQSGVSGFTAQRAQFEALTGTTIGVARVYKAASDFTYDSDMQLMVAAGVKMCLTLRPAYNPVSAADLASMTTLLTTLQNAGARADITLWHEPFFAGLTAAQFTAMIAYYGPSVRTYYPLVFVGSGPDLVLTNSYYPGDSAVDKIACDQYAQGTIAPDPGASIDNAAAIADGAVPPKPLGLWEFNGSTDAVNGQSQAFVTAWWLNVQAFFAARPAAGKVNADILLFDSGTGNWLGTALNQNCGFEGGTGNWYARSNCSVAPSPAQAYEGSGSLAMTASGTSNMTAGVFNTGTLNMPAAPGNTVTVSAWYRAKTISRSCAVAVDWLNAAGALLSTSFSATTPDATTGWTQVLASLGPAPASTAFARPVAFVNSPGGAGEVHYVDDVAVYVNQAGLSTTIWSAQDYRVALLGDLAAALNAAPVLSSRDARTALLSARTTP